MIDRSVPVLQSSTAKRLRHRAVWQKGLQCKQMDQRAQSTCRRRCHGRLSRTNPTPGDMADSTGAKWLRVPLRKQWPGVKYLFADVAYDDPRRLVVAATMLDSIAGVVRTLEDQHTFVPLPRHWFIERAFGWMVQWRLVRSYVRGSDVPSEMDYVTMSNLLLRGLSKDE